MTLQYVFQIKRSKCISEHVPIMFNPHFPFCGGEERAEPNRHVNCQLLACRNLFWIVLNLELN